jgi:CheY-like chemotaxis protein
MQRASATLLTLVNDILDFSKMDAGNIKLERVAFDIRRMFDDLAVSLRERNENSGIALRFELDASLPAALFGDPLRLRQIFINLADNAYKFTEKGSITIRAAVSERAANDITLAFAVEDTGIGMNQKQMGEIFAAFNQADNSSTRKYGGLGIGLAITREVIELMGGKIAVSSEEGKGTVFTFSCPFQIADDVSRTEKQADAEEDNDGENAVLKGLRVLLVEDNDINLMIAEELLNAAEIEVTTAENGKEALEQIKEAAKAHGSPPFDLVLMDLQMPVMDGYEATKIIRGTPEYDDMPVFALTAHAFPEEKERCLAIGMRDHLTKPIDVKSFYGALREAAAGKKKN